MRRSKIGLGREMKELGPGQGLGYHFLSCQRKQKNDQTSPLQRVTSRTWSTSGLHARTSVRLRIQILPRRNFAHWIKTSNSLASTAIPFFFLRQKGYGSHFHRWGDRHDFLFSSSLSLVHVSCREFDHRPDAVSFLFLDQIL